MPGTVDRYQLLDTIGAGTLGVLHRARDLQKGRTVALRLVSGTLVEDAAARAELLAEARRVAELSHPVVASLYECGEADDGVFIASEFVPGQPLAAMVAGAPLHPVRALDLAVQLADGLAAAEQLSLEHGALSTSSVIVTPKGVPKLLDIGLRRWTRAASQAPEPDAAGLAAVLFEMLAGRALRRGWPAEFRLPVVPSALQRLLARMAASRPGDAPSMLVVASGLRDVAAAIEAARPEAPAVPRVAPRTTAQSDAPAARTPWLIGVLVLVVLALGVWWVGRG